MAAGNAPDLSALNDAERAILALLAEGHTAKSIATITGKSVGSVNERLREARRKTGMGSSRELARAFAAHQAPAQENRNKQIEVAAPIAAPSDRVAPARARRIGGVTMAALIIGVIAGGAAAMLAAPPASPEADPLIGAFMLPGRDAKAETLPRQLYRKLRDEPRDSDWSEMAEVRLRRAFSAVPGVRWGEMRVTCRTSLCELAGIQNVPAGSAGGEVEQTSHGLRGAGFDVAMNGLNNVQLKPGEMRFLVYLQRSSRP